MKPENATLVCATVEQVNRNGGPVDPTSHVRECSRCSVPIIVGQAMLDHPAIADLPVVLVCIACGADLTVQAMAKGEDVTVAAPSDEQMAHVMARLAVGKA